MDETLGPVRRSRTSRLEAGEYFGLESTPLVLPGTATSGRTTALEADLHHVEGSSTRLENVGDKENSTANASSGLIPPTANGRDGSPGLDQGDLPDIARMDALRLPLPSHLYRLKEGNRGDCGIHLIILIVRLQTHRRSNR
jgi:hypothetical protein